MNARHLRIAPVALLLAACGDAPVPPPAPEIRTASTEAAPRSSSAGQETATPADQFLARLASHCGQAFEGRVIANEPPQDNDPFAGLRLVMHVRECSAGEVRVPFHVGDDHSRTWIVARTGSGLRLEHDHRHEDGSDDAVTLYGGDTEAPGSSQRQDFPVDQFSIDMFLREGLTASVSNVWAMEIEPGMRFLYELSRRAEQRLFRVEFDLTTPVATPPTPWGHPPLPGDGEP